MQINLNVCIQFSVGFCIDCSCTKPPGLQAVQQKAGQRVEFPSVWGLKALWENWRPKFLQVSSWLSRQPLSNLMYAVCRLHIDVARVEASLQGNGRATQILMADGRIGQRGGPLYRWKFETPRVGKLIICEPSMLRESLVPLLVRDPSWQGLQAEERHSNLGRTREQYRQTNNLGAISKKDRGAWPHILRVFTNFFHTLEWNISKRGRHHR